MARRPPQATPRALLAAPLLAVLGLAASLAPAPSSAAERPPLEAAGPISRAAPATPSRLPGPPVDFLREVRPLLYERCVLCHGPDEAEAGLRFDSRDGAMVDLGGYAALVPGDVEASELLWRVRSEDEDERMPPAEHDAALTPEQVDLLERWVAEGAPWVEHWAFAPLARPTPPTDGGSAWARGPLDAFIASGLASAGLAPAADADDLTWLRRASFDLLGLPPTTAEQDAFLAEAPAERRARAADRLLASPHFGERWARHLLDLVRYAETRGHEFDFAIPNAWEYRDWLVRALNADVGWDTLLREQVAGDLVEPPRRSPEGWNESVLGTGFWHLGEAAHAPVDLEVDHADRTANQLDVFGKAFLGLTLACARCHDHKFDPIPTKDYYALAGYVQSASYRQVRFETLERERALRAASDRLWLTEELSPRGAGDRGTSRLVLERLGRAAEQAEAARALVPEFERALVRSADARVVFDFEPTGAGGDGAGDRAPTWAELGWQAEGEAFGAGPMTLATLPAWYPEVAPDGVGFVNSHDGRQAPDSPAADRLTGRLLSPPFALDRPRLTLRVAGGNHPGETEVRLVVEGQVVRTATGHDSGRLREVLWELDALVAPPGGTPREARLELLDAHAGGWGHIVLDAVRLERAVDEEQVARLVTRDSLVDAATLRAWRTRLADDPGQADRAPTTRPDGAPARGVLWRAGVDPWWQDGAAFTERDAGQPWLTGDGDAPVAAFAAGVSSTGGAGTWPPPEFAGGAVGLDPAWRGLARAGITGKETTDVDWDGAGRTLRLPAWTLGEGALWYLVRGRGVAFAPVEGHRVLHGPLHVDTHLAFDTGHAWRWVEHAAMAEYVGLRAHLELSPADGDAWVGIAAVAQGPAPPFAAPDATLLELVAAHPELGGPLPTWTAAERDVALERAALAARVPKVSRTAPALLDGNGVDQRVLVRGQAATPGEVAPRAFLERFRSADEHAPDRLASGRPTSGRLELADRLLDGARPLVARTFANRLWLHLMGRGLVPTPDNLGSLAAYPSHPELLDWLACELVDGGWSVKRLARSVVLSRTYGLTGDLPSELDPDAAPRLDALFGRRGPLRLDAEGVRDAVLAVSGRLDATVGGPPVPLHLSTAMTGRGRPSASGPLDGAGRRSLYLEVRRNFLPPFQLVWDFPQPATTMGRRSRSNVPAQALALMNDAFVVAEAERWAARLLGEADLADDAARVERAWREALGRPPRPAEREAALAFLAPRATDPVGDPAAPAERWVDLCHAVFQLKEFVHVP